MKKLLLIFSIILALALSVGIPVFASTKTFITGYDVNNGCKAVTVERGVYVPGISLYPGCPNVGGLNHNAREDFAAGISVNGTEVISSSRAISGTDITATGKLSLDGVEDRWIQGTCTDASTTLFSVINPWSATSVVDKLILNVTNGTTTVQITVGTTTSATGLSADPSDTLIDDWELATSTWGTDINGLAGGARSATTGLGAPGTNSEDAIIWRSGVYIAGFAGEVGTTGGVTNAKNTFSCTYKIHSIKLAN